MADVVIDNLPEYLEDITPVASTEYSCRAISWTLTEPGSLYRNTYTYAWLRVRESSGWTGERLYLSPSRRITEGSYSRQPFTDAARTKMQAEILPCLARNFGEIWLELSRATTRYSNPEQSQSEAKSLRDAAEWWDRRAELIEMHTLAMLEFKPMSATNIDARRPLQVQCLHSHNQRSTYEVPAAAAYLEGEQVGWMLTNGELVPR